MNYTITINPSMLRAASIVAAKKDRREYLNGVCLKPVGNALHYLATNGAVVFIGTDGSESGRCAAEFVTALRTEFHADLIIPAEFVARMLKACGNGAQPIRLTMGIIDTALHFSAEFAGGIVNCRCREAYRYPDAHKVASQCRTERYASDPEHIDCRYVELAAKSMMARSGGKPAPVTIMERSPGTLTLLGDDCAVVIVGCRHTAGTVESRLDALGIGQQCPAVTTSPAPDL